MVETKKSETDEMKFIDATVDKHKEKISKNDQEKLKQLLTDVVKNKKTLQEAMKISDEMLEYFYSYAYNLYNSGNYEEANPAFKILTTINPSDPRFHFGLAACYHMQKEYQQAINVYMLLVYLDPSPIPYYHAADCFINLNKPGPAIYMLNAVESRCGDIPNFAPLKLRAIQIRDKLGKELEKIKDK